MLPPLLRFSLLVTLGLIAAIVLTEQLIKFCIAHVAEAFHTAFLDCKSVKHPLTLARRMPNPDYRSLNDLRMGEKVTSVQNMLGGCVIFTWRSGKCWRISGMHGWVNLTHRM